MALAINDSTNELPQEVDAIYQQTLLRTAQVRCPYFVGTMPGILEKKRGSSTCRWRRVENMTPIETPLAELTGNATYMQGRDAASLSVTDLTATMAKYGNFVILNEEVDLYRYNNLDDGIFRVIGINAGQSLNRLQRNVTEDNLTIVRVAGAAADVNIASAMTLGAIRHVVNNLSKNSAMTFSPMSTGNQLTGSTPILPAFIGLTHPDVAIDIALMSGFRSVESYASHTTPYAGEFGMISVAGMAVRFIQSEDSSVEAATGAAVAGTGLNGTANVDVYNTVIYGEEAIGSVGLGRRHTDGSYNAGDRLDAVELIHKPLGAGGTSDPYNEIETLAWKAYHVGKVLNATWGYVIRSGATKLNT